MQEFWQRFVLCCQFRKLVEPVTVSERQLVYGRAGEVELEGLLYVPDQHDPGPLVIDVHGGAWASGHYKSDRFYNRRLAEAGITVLAINFRHAPEFKHPAAPADIAAAVRYARTRLRSDFSSIGLVGSSSGGHLALYTGLLPDHAAHQTTAIESASGYTLSEGVSAEVDFVVGLWPVSVPLARYHYAVARAHQGRDTWGPNFTPDRLASSTLAYFGSHEAMDKASIPGILARAENSHLPRILLVQPELDLNVPVFINQQLHGALIEAGADVTCKLYPGVAHGFAQGPGPKTDECIEDLIRFIAG